VLFRAIDALQAQVFGVLSDVDVHGTLTMYLILGACNPKLAQGGRHPGQLSFYGAIIWALINAMLFVAIYRRLLPHLKLRRSSAAGDDARRHAVFGFNGINIGPTIAAKVISVWHLSITATLGAK
jgi:hypothetical protein